MGTSTFSTKIFLSPQIFRRPQFIWTKNFFWTRNFSGSKNFFGKTISLGPYIFLDQKIEQQESSPKFFSIDKLLFTLGKGENQSLILDICPGNICPEYHKL